MNTAYLKTLSLPEFLALGQREEDYFKWAALGRSLDYDGPVCWQIRPVNLLDFHRPESDFVYRLRRGIGPNFNPLVTDPINVLWIPRLVGVDKLHHDAASRRTALEQLRAKFELPAAHLTSFGDVRTLTLLVGGHHLWYAPDKPPVLSDFNNTLTDEHYEDVHYALGCWNSGMPRFRRPPFPGRGSSRSFQPIGVFPIALL